MTHLINLTDEYTTTDGKEVRVLCVDANQAGYPVAALIDGYVKIFTASGKFGGSHIAPYIIPKPKMLVRYVNVYPNADNLTREGADRWAHDNRLSCIRIEIPEGQFDE